MSWTKLLAIAAVALAASSPVLAEDHEVITFGGHTWWASPYYRPARTSPGGIVVEAKKFVSVITTDKDVLQESQNDRNIEATAVVKIFLGEHEKECRPDQIFDMGPSALIVSLTCPPEQPPQDSGSTR